MISRGSIAAARANGKPAIAEGVKSFRRDQGRGDALKEGASEKLEGRRHRGAIRL
jgi:hypothetical protein